MTLAGQVGVVTKNPGWYGKLVQWFTGSEAFHTVTAISETECVSAETPVVLVRPIDFFEDVQWTNVTFPSEALRQDSIRFVKAQIGHDYAYVDILLLVVARVLKRKTPWFIKNRLTDQRQWFCSELADAGLEAGKVNLFPSRPPSAVTPAEFLEVIEREQAGQPAVEAA